jgi:hypothetical protein
MYSHINDARVGETTPLKKSYGTEMELESGSESELASEGVSESKLVTYRVPIFITGVMSLLILLSLGTSHTGSGAVEQWGGGSGQAVMGSSTPAVDTCRDCTFAECKRSLCDDLVPFICTDGAAHDGCAATASAWLGNSVCSECCDSTHCDDQKPTEDDDSITLCASCTVDECSALSSKCGGADPFICLEGGGRYGCSDDKYHWPTALNGICTKCCDLESC